MEPLSSKKTLNVRSKGKKKREKARCGAAKNKDGNDY